MLRTTIILFACALGCSSSESSGTTPQKVDKPCEADCDRQVAAACPKTPANYADSCKQLCAAVKSSVASNCAAQFDAQYQCALDKVRYSCTSSGTIQLSPTGACAAEAQACAACNGGKPCILSVGG